MVTSGPHGYGWRARTSRGLGFLLRLHPLLRGPVQISYLHTSFSRTTNSTKSMVQNKSARITGKCSLPFLKRKLDFSEKPLSGRGSTMEEEVIRPGKEKTPQNFTLACPSRNMHVWPSGAQVPKGAGEAPSLTRVLPSL